MKLKYLLVVVLFSLFKLGNAQTAEFTYNGAADVNFRFPPRGSGGRALVHDASNILTLNYEGDFTGGTKIGSNVFFAPNGNISLGGSQAIAPMSLGTQHGVKLAIGNPGWANTSLIETGWTNEAGDYTDIKVAGAGGNNSFLRISKFGNIGLGTGSPTRRLQVGDGVSANSSQAFLAGTWNSNSSYHARLEFNDRNFGIGAGKISDISTSDDDLYLWTFNGPGRDIRFMSTPDANTDMSGWNNNMIIKGESGFVGIGTITPREKLSVNGNIRAREIKVETDNWPDFVFTKEHKLPSLIEVESYIKTNNHLPEIPSAKEVEAEGISLGEMNKKLLQKIEELTLYMIEQGKEIKEIKAQNQNLKTELSNLKAELKP